ncbi:5-formyltetrahydrofolate cyclo-ligase [Methanobrevibacter ruminantium M1]|uniref:5-formyltetrahydrofolate cyclo-ligase n=1 Tax=Methanobrevibacter ruminantium (strain ATCC 35063 / DSM 1093 / JCM 13430 / OCM 146 / M1) TaxID=634498 RepID=D3E224_METRM|nr:5-formyltetrahydrofolate cyclo-ligase [Methanobrevibacter ruminantium]ADC46585.1 5-formyltetrahydrofolate cyclo-ligase [Methanobrevibacter ruminantium M1]
MTLKEEKDKVRKSIYDNLFNNGFSNRPNGDYGKIPDFKGSDIAAELLSKTEEWKSSITIFSSPDAAQTPVRYLALKDNKNLIMASPNLTHGYLFLEGQNIKEIEEASTKEGAFKHCSKKDISNINVDLVVEGSVGVDRMGHRIGKGKGFADMEIEDLKKRNIINNTTPIATTIHPLQLVNHIPTESHDQRINMIVTTREIIRV